MFVGSQRYTVANNHYLENYDPTKPEDYIIYLDANNLYGWAMSQSLPYKDLKFSNISLDEVLETSDENDEGYILEIDLRFPDEIHDKLKEFPPCPENVSPDLSWLSDFQKQLILEKNNNKMRISKCAKLIPHFHEHKNYCIHYRNLKYVKSLGVELGKVHNIISFKQKPWLKSYIDFNTDKRKEAKNEFEKDFLKTYE